MNRPKRVLTAAVLSVAVVGMSGLTSLLASPADMSGTPSDKAATCAFCQQEANSANDCDEEHECSQCRSGESATKRCTGEGCGSGTCEAGNCRPETTAGVASTPDEVVGDRPGHGRGRGPGPGPRAGRGRGAGKGGHGGRGPDAEFQRDHRVLHDLLEHHDEIRRTVKRLRNGVETLTESDNPKVARAIQEHVHAMYRRVDENRPIRRRDPLFNAIFSNASKVTMLVEETEQGVRVIETSDDPFVARLIQAHAAVVSAFVKHGHEEAMKNHPVPTAE